jgi:hypothetical protein
MKTAWTNEARMVKPHVIPMERRIPGSSLSDLPMPFHQIRKNVLGLNQMLPTIILTTTHTTTAHQLIELKLILACSGSR